MDLPGVEHKGQEQHGEQLQTGQQVEKVVEVAVVEVALFFADPAAAQKVQPLDESDAQKGGQTWRWSAEIHEINDQISPLMRSQRRNTRNKVTQGFVFFYK